MERFLLNLSFYSAPKSHISDDGHDLIIFTNDNIDAILEFESTFHFNRGDLNFFSQYGKAAYSYWCRSFSLTDAEIQTCNYSHDIAVAILFDKLRLDLQKNGITEKKIRSIEQRFDCRAQIELFFPDEYPGLFRIQKIDSRWMSDMYLDFEFSMLSDPLLKELKTPSLI